MVPDRAHRRDRAVLVALSLAATLLALPGRADPVGGPPGDPAPLQLVVNGVPGEVVAARLVPDGDVWVPLPPLGRSGLQGLEGERRQVGSEAWVSLRSLAPSLAYTIDEPTLQLRIDARAEVLGRTVIDANPTSRPPGLATGGHPSAFVNYAAQVDDARRVGAFGEVGAGAGNWLATSGLSRNATGEVVRGLSGVTRDDPDRLRRFVAGDAVASAGPLGGTVVLGGVGVAREFSLDPWFVRQPLPRTSAVALTPSTLEVYVNGRLVRREQVAPGTLDLTNLPIEAGAGNVRTVLRDAYGRTQEVDGRYYFSGGLLAPRVSDYGAHLGLRRQALGTRSFEYGDALFVGHYRSGLSDALTAGMRLEAGPSIVSAGPSLTAAVPVGELELAAAVSRESGAVGGAASAAWSWTSRRTSVGLRATTLSRSYANGSLGATQDRALHQASGYVARPLGTLGTVGVEGSLSRSRDLGSAAGAALRASFGIGRGATLGASLGWTQQAGGRSGANGMLLLTHSLGPSTTASASADRASDGLSRGSVGLQRALPAGTGVGYRLDGSTTAGNDDLSGVVQAQGEHGRVEAAVQRTFGRNGGYASLAGGVVAMDRELFLTRPVQDGFALVQVPGVAGVRTYLNHQEVARTNANGNALVTGVLPYHANKLSIRAADVPIDYALDKIEQLVAPPRRVGARVRFDVQRMSTLTGTLEVEEAAGRVTPSYGELRVADARVEPAPIGADGRFYLSNLPPGRHDAEVTYANGVCRFTLDVPPTAKSFTDLGDLRCALRASAGTPAPQPVSTAAPDASPSALAPDRESLSAARM